MPVYVKICRQDTGRIGFSHRPESEKFTKKALRISLYPKQTFQEICISACKLNWFGFWDVVFRNKSQVAADCWGCSFLQINFYLNKAELKRGFYFSF
jgi:hypothetical protein